VAAVGRSIRTLAATVPPGLQLPDGFCEPRLALPGVLVVRAPKHCAGVGSAAADLDRFCAGFSASDPGLASLPLVVIVDDSELAARSLADFLWVTFTRSNPAVDVAGIGAFTEHKHWGCRGSLVIDARQKVGHAQPLVENAKITARVDQLFRAGGPLAGIE
jgi:4-hydroxy-3-polyprenylbenzoate decarboxylase